MMRWELTEKAKHGANDLHDSGKSDLTNIRDLFECNFEFQSTRFFDKKVLHFCVYMDIHDVRIATGSQKSQVTSV